jgi:GAF domain-containing protein
MSVIPHPDGTMSAAPAVDEIERLHARLAALEQERKHLLAVIEILQEISGSLHFADIVQSVALRLGETFGLDRCSIFLAERGGRRVRLVASYEDPGIRNYVVDLDRYPELRRAIQTGETVFIADASSDPSLSPARGALTARRVKSITAIPISWRGTTIGAILLRTFRDGPAFSTADLQFCQVVANLTAKALRNAHRFEKLRQQRGENTALLRREREQAALIGFLRNLLSSYPPRATSDEEPDLASELSPEIGRLSGVAQAVLSQEAASR